MPTKPTLFTYCLRYDDGAAPNPFWDVCTLVICKPVIRRTAMRGSWVVGTGSKNSLVGDTSGLVVYAMLLTEEKLTMRAYDEHCRKELRNKIPDMTAADPRLHVGDCIYDFTKPGPLLRPSVHSEGNRRTDLSGEYALLSRDYYYFGKNGVRLPGELLPIVKQGQGHRSRSNDAYVDQFVEWIREQPRGITGDPQMWNDKVANTCGACRAEDDEEDLRIGETEC